MKIHSLIQGSPEWLAYRTQHFNASDAPAMLGVSPYKTRAALLREMHSGVAPAVDIGTQKRYDNGHRAEALARPLAEEFIGQELYPVTGSEGRLSASFDGLTLDESEALEHKALNIELRRAIQDEDSGPQLPIYHRVQMEQQLLISGARRVLFMASEWADEDTLVEERHCWYYPDPKLRRQIVEGWAQFERDLAAYVLPDAAEPPAVGKAPETLPALRIEVTGEVTASNLAEFKQTALAAISSVNRNLVTDQDFADADKAIKWCGDVESRLAAAKEHALSQTASIDALFKALDDIAAESKRVRLDLTKVVDRRKLEVREQAIVHARRALDAHIATLNAEIAPMRLPGVAADFAGAIKGKRTVASMQDALDGVLSVAKIAAEADARAIRANLAAFKERAAGLEFLFADLGDIVHKAADDFILLVQARIDAHKAAEERRRAEADARRIEDARIAALRETERQDRAAESARVAAAALAAAPQVAPHAALVQTAATPIEQPAPSPRADEPATLNLGTICGRLGFTVNAAFLADTLHIQPARVDKVAKLYRESQFALICRQLQSHVGAMAELYAGEPA
jgi:putative phage-type endonuclease